MAFDFPSSPTDGQTFTPPGGPTYRFVDPKWTVLGSSASVEISDTAPSNPSPGNLWWEADTGKLWVWYADGTSSQWVEAAGGGRGPAAAGWRNRIINGDFSIDQRNNGGAIAVSTGTSAYTSDRWIGTSLGSPGAVYTQQVADVSLLGEFNLLVGVSVIDATIGATDTYLVGQRIEGRFVNDLNWGGASAKSITISFDVIGSAAFTLPLSVRNSAQNRAWLGSFNVTTGWTKVTFNVPGDTTGTWLKDNGVGLDVRIGLGVGSNFQGVTGWQAANILTLAGMSNVMAAAGNISLRNFQLEVGTQATEFERVPYDQQLARCQRYYETGGGGPFGFCGNLTNTAVYAAFNGKYVVTKRAAPTLALTNFAANGFPAASGSGFTTTEAFYESRTANITGNAGTFQSNWTASAEL